MHSQSITVLKMHKNVKVPSLLQKSLNQNGRIIGSTTHHYQLSYQKWKLLDQWPI